MNTPHFFINYFKNIWTPKGAFNHRKEGTWLQLLLLFFFLTLFMILPVYRHYSTIERFSLEDFYPLAIEQIDNEFVETLRNSDGVNEEFLQNGETYSKQSSNGMIGIGDTTNSLSITPDAVNALLFSQKSFLISDENGQYEEVMYSSGHKLSQVRSKEELVIELSRIYTQENRSSIIWTFSVVVYLFLFLGLFFIVFVYAYLLYLMKDFTLSMIMTYRESVKLILNLLGGPTLLAVAYSFYRFNIFTMLALLIIGLMLQLFILYRQTKFQDEIYE